MNTVPKTAAERARETTNYVNNLDFTQSLLEGTLLMIKEYACKGYNSVKYHNGPIQFLAMPTYQRYPNENEIKKVIRSLKKNGFLVEGNGKSCTFQVKW